jgi:hypothetical protein
MTYRLPRYAGSNILAGYLILTSEVDSSYYHGHLDLD